MKRFALRIMLLAFMLCLVFTFAAKAQQAESLVGYWPFEEGKGDTVDDQSGKGNNGKINGDAKWVEGKFGKALDFAPGANVEIPDSDTLRDMDGYTIALWIKFNAFSADWNHIVEKDGSYGITVNSGGGDFRYTPNSGKVWTESKFKVKENTWYYITMTADKSAVTFYVDGKKQGDFQETIVYNNNPVNIAHGPSYPVDGTIDEVQFWAVVLTQDEINVAMKGILAVSPSEDKLLSTWASIKSF